MQFLVAALVASSLAGCGGTVSSGEEGAASGGASSRDEPFDDFFGKEPPPLEDPSESTGGSEPYIEPDCPDEPAPPSITECDPLDPYVDCGFGEGCYPYLDYPYGEGCGHATFGAICAPIDTGEQGDLCGEDLGYCSPGFMCVVGAGGGSRCGKICEAVLEHECPPGLVCGPTDVKGYGVCF